MDTRYSASPPNGAPDVVSLLEHPTEILAAMANANNFHTVIYRLIYDNVISARHDETAALRPEI